MKTCYLTPPTPRRWVYDGNRPRWGCACVIVVALTPSPTPSSACSLVKGRFSFAHGHGGAGSDRQARRRRGTEWQSNRNKPIAAPPKLHPDPPPPVSSHHESSPDWNRPLALTPGAPATVPARPLDNCCATLVVRFPRRAERNAISVSRPMEAACTNSPPDPHYPGTWHPKLLSLDAPRKARA